MTMELEKTKVAELPKKTLEKTPEPPPLAQRLDSPAASTPRLSSENASVVEESRKDGKEGKESKEIALGSHTSRLVSDLQKKFLRAERFGVPVQLSVKEKRNSKAERKGVKGVEVDLTNQVVRVLGSSSVKSMIDALEQTGRRARLIGQGVPDDFLVSAAVAEFKGPTIFGVVRLAQVNMELARVEANFNGQ
ncbi:hypothetical protein H6P81_020108 [Aristolochia fimbriata]|uniref:Uncharacterized protein n=1 Tax=Aristolochia fimbriata TaxID=158543 RepID=A0AAV7DTM9_ARIFI|nr:hypothetical protein H6P81_020108 [Aristolochia fimbriata]